MTQDNYIRPEDKQTWGFGGGKGKVTVGKDDEGSSETKPKKSTETAARKNGGGADTKSGE